MECTIKQNIKECTCTYSCDKRGKCCECVAYHRRMDQLPGCFFPPDEEKTYDRSFQRFARIYSNK